MEREIDTKRMRLYTIDDGWQVVVGKTDVDNDYISCRFSEPGDLWFHVDQLPGSHALLLHREGMEARRPIQEQAAAIAAWFSKGRKASRIGVIVAPASAVSKGRKSPAGQVRVESKKILRVTPGLPE